MSEPFLGQIVMFGGNFAPRSWAFCSGQLLPIAQNSALFSILGTSYGGDGRTSFALPELRGRVAIHAGNGPGLSSRPLGVSGGTETNVMNTGQLPAHNHTANSTATLGVLDDDANTDEAAGNVLANAIGGGQSYATGAPDATMNSAAVQVNTTVNNTGNNQPINNMMPFTVVNYIIALQGIFPSRS